MWIKEFSNFYLPAEHPGITFDCINYPTVEHFFVAMKTLDVNQRLMIAAIDHPAEAKKRGYSLDLRPDWKKVRVSVLKWGVRRKFEFGPMAKLLLATGNEEIVHQVHWHDNFWADCICPKCVNVEAKNMLGVLLMRIREDLRDVNRVPCISRKVFYGTPCRIVN